MSWIGPDEPIWYRNAAWDTEGNNRNGVFYVGDEIEIPLKKNANYHPQAGSMLSYEVRNYYGEIVSTGSFPEEDTSFLPVSSERGGWKPGWYRVYISGTNNYDYNNNYDWAHGTTNFCIVRDDAHFPAMPSATATSGYNSESPDYPTKGVMGLGTSRLIVSNVRSLSSGDSLDNALLDAELATTWWSDHVDPNRPRPIFCLFNNDMVDRLWIAGASANWWARVYAKEDTLNGDNLYITTSSGTNANTDKVRVYYPNSTTLVETWDNLSSASNAQTTINASSNYIRLYAAGENRCAYAGPTAIGTDYRDGYVYAVSQLYDAGVTHFEGPVNEPGMFMAPWIGEEYVQCEKLYAAYVHAGNANAKAIGPCDVSIMPTDNSWITYFNAGGGQYYDEISFHAYNYASGSNLPHGRLSMETFTDELASHGLGSKPLWQTESSGSMDFPYGVYHPRRARKGLMDWLLMEQYGVDREKNNWWYDREHGFWDVPVWFENSDRSLEPAAVLGRVLAEETWGKAYDHALDFGFYGDAIFLGSVYSSTAGNTVVLMATSFMDNASVVLEVSGSTADVTVVDGFGNEKTVPLAEGRVLVPLTDVPSYVRLAASASATVYKVNDWSPLGIGTSISPGATTKQAIATTYSEIADDGWTIVYGSAEGSAPKNPPKGYVSPGEYVTLIWTNPTLIERVIIWCGPSWQPSGTLIDFDVETYDGATWTTAKTITKPSPPWFKWGSKITKCWYETYWDEQWVFDVELDSAISCRGVRINTREASYGGEPLPDNSTPPGNFIGQGMGVQGWRIQEISVMDVNRYAGIGA